MPGLLRSSLFATLFFSLSTLADEAIQPLSLKDFVGKSQFTRLEIEWMLPKGRQVADGVPFEIDGIIELYGSLATQSELNIRTNVNGIPIGKKFEQLHLLATSGGGQPVQSSRLIANVHFIYTDGTTNSQSIVFRKNIRHWFGPRHEEDTPLEDARCRPAWSMELSEAARTDKRSRFFHVVLDNPSPEKVVSSINLESMKSVGSLLVAGMSVGPKNAALPDTLPNQPPQAKDAVLKGTLVDISGKVSDQSGNAFTNVTVRIVGVRSYNEIDDAHNTTLSHPTVGTETRTDAAGAFRFANVPDDQLYRVLFVAEHCEPGIFLASILCAAPLKFG